MNSLCLLLFTLFSETRSMNMEKSFQKVEGEKLEITCTYDAAYKNYDKYWCKGYYRNSCHILVQTHYSNSTDNGRIRIEDKPAHYKVSVTIQPLHLSDAEWYGCGIHIDYILDVMDYTNIKVSKDTDECRENTGICGKDALCTNTYGSYYCTCNTGFGATSANQTFINSDCKGQSCCYPDPTIPPHSPGNLNLSTKTQSIFNRITSTKFDKSNNEMQKEAQQNITVLLREVEQYILDDVLSLLNKSGEEEIKINHEVKETALAAHSVPVNSSNVEEMLNLTAGNTTMSVRKKTVINGTKTGIIPVAILLSFHGTSIEAILSAGHLMNQKSTSNTRHELKSQVVIATMSSEQKHNFTDPVVLTFWKNKNQEDKVAPYECVFWKNDDKNGSYWSTEGCSVSSVDTNHTHVTCHCYHLSSFAVLMSITEEFQDERPLKIISDIGLTLSAICLTVCVMTFWFCKTIQNASTTLLLNLCACLLVGDLLFLFGISQTKNKTLCKVIAGFLHYFFLACFTWMCLGALQLHLMVRNIKVVKAFQTHVIRRRYMYPVGYGAPAITVAISASVFPAGYGTNKVCWLSQEKGFQWSFVGPVCSVILINIILFVKTVHMLRQHFSVLNKDVSTINNTKVLLFKAVAQFLVFGCTWIFGIFQFRSEMFVMSYIFTILNSFHGVFVFLLYCAANRLVVEEYRGWVYRLFRIKKKEKEYEVTVTSVTAVTSSSTMGEIQAIHWINKEVRN